MCVFDGLSFCLFDWLNDCLLRVCVLLWLYLSNYLLVCLVD